MARRLMDMHGITLNGRPLIAYHDHNAAATMPKLRQYLHDGATVVYLSDAGTPLVADPGYKLAQEVIKEGIALSSTPGACAAVMALTLSGLPSDRFMFAGFPPPKREARRKFLSEFSAVPGTIIFYESPRRLAGCLTDMAGVFGNREAAVARELTKMFEEVRRGTLTDLAAHYTEAGAPKGEIVLLVAPPAPVPAATEEVIDTALRTALQTLSVKDAAREVATYLNLPRKVVYERALVVKEAL